jgi:hypothetical protein
MTEGKPNAEALPNLSCLSTGHDWRPYDKRPRWFKHECDKCGEVTDTLPQDRKYF